MEGRGERSGTARVAMRLALAGLLGLALAGCAASGGSLQPPSAPERGAVATAAPRNSPKTGDSTAAAFSPATKVDEGGQVTVAVTWRRPGADLEFVVAMDTHSVDLDQYDLGQLASLRVDGGPEVRPLGWDAPRGGHHRSGTLTFPSTLADGSPLITAETRVIELVIRDVAGVPERRFRWTR